MDSLTCPQIVMRKIGALSVVDLVGDLVGSWTVKVQDEIQSLSKSDLLSVFVLNLKPIQSIDALGAKAVVDSVVSRERGGLMRGNDQVMRIIKAYPAKKCMNVINGEEDLAKLFGKEMAQNKIDKEDQRLFLRIKTALPLIFSCVDKSKNACEFHAIITNMSEGGLFAEYVDLEDVPKSKSIINPYELNLLKLQIKNLSGDTIQAEGKVVHVRNNGAQVGIGIEFYRLENEEKIKIKELLANIEK